MKPCCPGSCAATQAQGLRAQAAHVEEEAYWLCPGPTSSSCTGLPPELSLPERGQDGEHRRGHPDSDRDAWTLSRGPLGEFIERGAGGRQVARNLRAPRHILL